MNFGDKIRELRLERGLTMEQVGNVVGVNKSTVKKWESGYIANMRRDKIELLAQALGVTPSYLMGWTDKPNALPIPPEVNNLTPISRMRTHKIPMVGAVAAGEPIWEEDNYDIYVDGPVKADFAMTIQGDSMEPNYYNGDVIYVRSQSMVNNGQIAVVVLDNTAALKHVYRGKTAFTLISDNPKYEPMVLPYDEYDYVRIIGVPVGYTRMFDGHNKP